MGLTTLKAEMETGNIEIDGDKLIARSMHSWLGLSPFAKVERPTAGRVAAGAQG
jgi:hypothetical protein